MGKEYRQDIDIKSSILDFERILLFDSFEEATVWLASGTATLPAFTKVNTEYAAHGIFVGKLFCTDVGGAEAGDTVLASRYFPYFGQKKIIASQFVSFSNASDVSFISLKLDILDGSINHQFGVGFNTSTSKIQYLNPLGAWANASNTTIPISPAGLTYFKVMVNLVTLKYISLQVGTLIIPFTASSYFGAFSANPIESHVTLQITSAGSGTNPITYFDALLIQAD